MAEASHGMKTVDISDICDARDSEDEEVRYKNRIHPEIPVSGSNFLLLGRTVITNRP